MCGWKPDAIFIDCAAERNETFFVLCVQGVVTAVHVDVPYVGVIHTAVEAFAKCRAEIREYLRPFTNWPRKDLVSDLSPEGCGRMTFQQTTFTASARPVCPHVYL